MAFMVWWLCGNERPNRLPHWPENQFDAFAPRRCRWSLQANDFPWVWGAIGATYLEFMAVQVNGVVGHGQVTNPYAHLVIFRTHKGEIPGNTRLFQVHKLKSSMVMIFGV